MDDPRLDPTPTARLARWFQPSPAELAGLIILVVGAVVLSVVLWFQAAQRPSDLGSDAGLAGVAVAADRTTDGPAPGITGDETPADGADDAPLIDAPLIDAPLDDAPLDDAEVTVHVTGAVATPGLVVLPHGGRVGDAVLAAGGLVPGAQEERINLARPLVDGEHVHVLREGEDPPAAADGPSGGPVAGAGPSGGGGIAPDGRVDINRAGPAELETLPGVGPARAEAIVAHREQHGPFSTPGDLRAVSGIGEVIFQRLAELVTVG